MTVIASRYQEYMFSSYFKTELPTDWNVKKLSLIADEHRHGFVDGPFGSDLKSNEYQADGVPLIQLNNIRDGHHVLRNMKYISEGKKEQLNRHIALPGDVVIAKMAEPVARAAIVTDEYRGYVIVADCVKLSSDPSKVNLRYLVWAINSYIVRTKAELVSTGTTRIRINLAELKKLKIPYPPLEEQHQIALFLDHETAHIDQLIAKQERLIELLKEKRQAVISHAVTKGLDPDAPMKDSGVEWLGEVPEGWFVGRLGYYATVNNGTTPSKANDEYWFAGDVPWLSSGAVNQGEVTVPSEYITSKALAECSLKILPEDTVIIGMIGQGKTRGMSAILRISATINQNLASVETSNRLHPNFILFVLKTAYKSIRNIGRGGNQAALDCEIISDIIIPIPEYKEQIEIVNLLESQVEVINRIIEKTGKAVILLKERRTALISAAVTGKIDVRDWAPQQQTTKEDAA